MPRRDDRNRTSFWTDASLAYLSLMKADFQTHSFAPHFHHTYVIAITEAGCATVRSPAGHFTAAPGNLLVFNPMEVQSAWMGGSAHWSYRSFYVSREAMRRLSGPGSGDAAPRFGATHIEDEALAGRFLAMHRALETCRMRDVAPELLRATFAELAARWGVIPEASVCGPAGHCEVRNALRLFEARFREPVTVQEVAGELKISRFRLIDLFKRHVGQTPHDYLVQLRLDDACRRLRRGSPSAAAAVDAGFYDQPALCRSFKRRFAITPAQFARASGRVAQRPVQ